MALYQNRVSHLVFKDFIPHKGKGRISISRQLLKAHCDGYHPHISRQLATELKRFIKSQPKHKRRSPEFVDDIRRKIICLHEYNLQTANVKLKYPRSEQLEAILIKYIELECELLYSFSKKVGKEHEEGVTQRVLRLLRVIVHDSVHNSESDLNSTVQICYKTLLKLYASVRADCDCENNLVANTIIKLVDKLGCRDTIDVLKGEFIPLPEDMFLTSSHVTTVRQSLKTSDYESDFDSKSDDELELFVVEDSFNSKSQKPSTTKNLSSSLNGPVATFASDNLTYSQNIANRSEAESNFASDKLTYSQNIANRSEAESKCPLISKKLNNHVDNNTRKQNIDVPKNIASIAETVTNTAKCVIKNTEHNSHQKLGKSDENVSKVVDVSSNRKERTNRECYVVATIEVLDDEEEATLDISSNGESQLPSSTFGNFLPLNEIKLEENEENHSPNYSVSNSENQNFLNSNKESRNSNSAGLNRLKNNSSNDSAKDAESAILISDSEDEPEPSQEGIKKIDGQSKDAKTPSHDESFETNEDVSLHVTSEENVEQLQVEEIALFGNKSVEFSDNNIQKEQLSDILSVEYNLTQDEDQTHVEVESIEEFDTTQSSEKSIRDSLTTPETDNSAEKSKGSEQPELDISVEIPENSATMTKYKVSEQCVVEIGEPKIAETVNETVEVVLEEHETAEEVPEVIMQTELTKEFPETAVENDVSEAAVETEVTEATVGTMDSEAIVEKNPEVIMQTELTKEFLETTVENDFSEATVETEVTEATVETKDFEAIVDSVVSEATVEVAVTEEIREASVEKQVAEDIFEATVETAAFEEIPEASAETEVAKEISEATVEIAVTEESSEASVENEVAIEISDATVEISKASVETEIAKELFEATVKTVDTGEICEASEEKEVAKEISEANVESAVFEEIPEANVETEVAKEISEATGGTAVSEEIPEASEETEVAEEIFEATVETAVFEEIPEANVEAEVRKAISEAPVETVDSAVTVETKTAHLEASVGLEISEVIVETEATDENFEAAAETDVAKEMSEPTIETEVTKDIVDVTKENDLSENNNEITDLSVTRKGEEEELTNNRYNSIIPEVLSTLQLIQRPVPKPSEAIQTLNTYSDVQLAVEQNKRTFVKNDLSTRMIDYSMKMQPSCDVITNNEDQPKRQVSQPDLQVYNVDTQYNKIIKSDICQPTQDTDGSSQQLPMYGLPQGLPEVQYVEYDSPKKDAALAMLADLAYHRKTLEVETNKKSEVLVNKPDSNVKKLQTTPKRRKSTKEKLEVKNTSSRKSLPRAVKRPKESVNKKITQKITPKLKGTILKEPLKLLRDEDSEYKPHDFISENSIEPLKPKIYDQKLDTATTSEDSNDSCERRLVIHLENDSKDMDKTNKSVCDEETITDVNTKSVDKNIKSVFDEETITEVLEFVKTENKSAICISIPENEDNCVPEGFDILKQMEDFVKINDSVLAKVVDTNELIESKSNSEEKPEAKVLKTTDHSIVKILNRTTNTDTKMDEPVPELEEKIIREGESLPENFEHKDEATAKNFIEAETEESNSITKIATELFEKSTAKNTIVPSSVEGGICDELDTTVQLDPKDLTVGMVTDTRNEDSCEKIFKTKAEVKSYEDKLQPNPFVLLMNYEERMKKRKKLRSKSSEGIQQRVSCFDRSRSSSVDFNSSSDLSFNEIKDLLKLDESTTEKIQALNDKSDEIVVESETAKDLTVSTNKELVQENTQDDNLQNVKPIVETLVETTQDLSDLEVALPKPVGGEITISLVIDVAEKLKTLPVSDVVEDGTYSKFESTKITEDTQMAEDLSQKKPVEPVSDLGMSTNAKEMLSQTGSVNLDKTNSKTLDEAKGRALENTIKKMKEKMESEKVKKEKAENSVSRTKSNNIQENEQRHVSKDKKLSEKAPETSKKEDRHHKRRRSRSLSKSRTAAKKSNEASRSSSKSKSSDKRLKEKHSDSDSERVRRSKSKSVDLSYSHEEPNGHKKRHNRSSSKSIEDSKSKQSSDKKTKHKTSELKEKPAFDPNKTESKSPSEVKDKQSDDSDKRRKSHDVKEKSYSEKKHKSKNDKLRDKEDEEKVKTKINIEDDIKKKSHVENKSFSLSDDTLFKVDEKVSKTISKKISKTQEDLKKLNEHSDKIDDKHISHKTKSHNSSKVSEQCGKNNGRVNDKEKSKAKDEYRRSNSKEKKVEMTASDKREKNRERSKEIDSSRHKNKSTEGENMQENKGRDKENFIQCESKVNARVKENKRISKQKETSMGNEDSHKNYKVDIYKKRKCELLENAPPEKMLRLENEKISDFVQDVNMERPKTPTICLFEEVEKKPDFKTVEMKVNTHSEKCPHLNKTNLDIPLPVENLTTAEPLDPIVEEVEKPLTPVVVTTSHISLSYDHFKDDMTAKLGTKEIPMSSSLIETTDEERNFTKPSVNLVEISDSLNAPNKVFPDDKFRVFDNNLTNEPETIVETSSSMKIQLQNESVFIPSSEAVSVSSVFSSAIDDHVLSSTIDSTVKHLPRHDTDLSLVSTTITNSAVTKVASVSCDVRPITVESTTSSSTTIGQEKTCLFTFNNTETVNRENLSTTEIFSLDDISPTKLPPLGSTQSLDFISPTTSTAEISNSMNLLQTLGTSTINFMNEVSETSEIDVQTNKQNSFHSNYVTQVTEIRCFGEKESVADHNYTLGGPLLGGNNEDKNILTTDKNILTTGLSLSTSPEEFQLNEGHLEELSSFSENNFIEENVTLDDMESLLPCKKEKTDFNTDDSIPKPEDVQNDIKRLNMLVDILQNEPKTTSVHNTMDHGSKTDLGTDYAVEQLELLSQVVGDINNINIMDSNVSLSVPATKSILDDAVSETTSHDPINLPLTWNSYSNFMSSDGNQKVVVEPVEQCPVTTVDQMKKDFIDGISKNVETIMFTSITAGSNKFLPFVGASKIDANNKKETLKVHDEIEKSTVRKSSRVRVTSPEKSSTTQHSSIEIGKIRVKTDLIAKTKSGLNDSSSVSCTSENGQNVVEDKTAIPTQSKPPLGYPRLSKFAPLLETLKADANKNKTLTNKNETTKTQDETEQFLTRRHNRTRVSTPKQNTVTQQRHSKSPPQSKKAEIVSFDIDVNKPQKTGKIQVKKDLKVDTKSGVSDLDCIIDHEQNAANRPSTCNFHEKKTEEPKGEHSNSSTKHNHDKMDKEYIVPKKLNVPHEAKITIDKMNLDDSKKRTLVDEEDDKGQRSKKLKEGAQHPGFDETGKYYIMENFREKKTEEPKSEHSNSSTKHIRFDKMGKDSIVQKKINAQNEAKTNLDDSKKRTLVDERDEKKSKKSKEGTQHPRFDEAGKDYIMENILNVQTETKKTSLIENVISDIPVEKVDSEDSKSTKPPPSSTDALFDKLVTEGPVNKLWTQNMNKKQQKTEISNDLLKNRGYYTGPEEHQSKGDITNDQLKNRGYYTVSNPITSEPRNKKEISNEILKNRGYYTVPDAKKERNTQQFHDSRHHYSKTELNYTSGNSAHSNPGSFEKLHNTYSTVHTSPKRIKRAPGNSSTSKSDPHTSYDYKPQDRRRSTEQMKDVIENSSETNTPKTNTSKEDWFNKFNGFFDPSNLLLFPGIKRIDTPSQK